MEQSRVRIVSVSNPLGRDGNITRWATIRIEGKDYVLTNEEVNQLYRYQEHCYFVQDAKRQVNTKILSYMDSDEDPEELNTSRLTTSDMRDDCTAADQDVFTKLLNLTDTDFDVLADEFRDDHDCNNDDNSAWQNLIEKYIKNM